MWRWNEEEREKEKIVRKNQHKKKEETTTTTTLTVAWILKLIELLPPLFWMYDVPEHSESENNIQYSQ